MRQDPSLDSRQYLEEAQVELIMAIIYEGNDAYITGRLLERCPYLQYTRAWWSWRRGWVVAQSIVTIRS